MSLKAGDKVYWPLYPSYTGEVVQCDDGRLQVKGNVPGLCSGFYLLRGWKRRKLRKKEEGVDA